MKYIKEYYDLYLDPEIEEDISVICASLEELGYTIGKRFVEIIESNDKKLFHLIFGSYLGISLEMDL